jgi:hypothetical protein
VAGAASSLASFSRLGYGEVGAVRDRQGGCKLSYSLCPRLQFGALGRSAREAEEVSVIGKLKTATNAMKEGGLPRVLGVASSRYGVALPAKLKWKLGIESELTFWDDYFRTKGLQWPNDYQNRLDPEFPLQPGPAALLPTAPQSLHLLDVGAGPLTQLGKKYQSRQLHITAVDALADKYDAILDKYGVRPIVRTQQMQAERLTNYLSPNTFDLCYAHNCLDHAYDPKKAIVQMIAVAKPACYILLEHFVNEAENANYEGLHQWNFSMSSEGDFLIGSKKVISI